MLLRNFSFLLGTRNITVYVLHLENHYYLSQFTSDMICCGNLERIADFYSFAIPQTFSWLMVFRNVWILFVDVSASMSVGRRKIEHKWYDVMYHIVKMICIWAIAKTSHCYFIYPCRLYMKYRPLQIDIIGNYKCYVISMNQWSNDIYEYFHI